MTSIQIKKKPSTSQYRKAYIRVAAVVVHIIAMKLQRHTIRSTRDFLQLHLQKRKDRAYV